MPDLEVSEDAFMDKYHQLRDEADDGWSTWRPKAADNKIRDRTRSPLPNEPGSSSDAGVGAAKPKSKGAPGRVRFDDDDGAASGPVDGGDGAASGPVDGGDDQMSGT
eukprot:8773887-Karenia_brevis.AAC.1